MRKGRESLPLGTKVPRARDDISGGSPLKGGSSTGGRLAGIAGFEDSFNRVRSSVHDFNGSHSFISEFQTGVSSVSSPAVMHKLKG